MRSPLVLTIPLLLAACLAPFAAADGPPMPPTVAAPPVHDPPTLDPLPPLRPVEPTLPWARDTYSDVTSWSINATGDGVVWSFRVYDTSTRWTLDTAAEVTHWSFELYSWSTSIAFCVLGTQSPGCL